MQEGTRAGTLAGKDRHHLRRQRLRFPRTPWTPVQRPRPCQAVRHERARVRGEGPKHRQGQQAGKGRKPDRSAQSGSAGMGSLSPTRRQEGTLWRRGRRYRQSLMAVGKEKASHKAQVLGHGYILPHAGRSQVGLRRERRRREGQSPTSLALLGVKDADQTAYKDQSRSASIRSRLGGLLRTTPWRQDGDPPHREKEAAPSLEGTRGHLFRLHPTDHRDRAMAQSSHHLANERR